MITEIITHTFKVVLEEHLLKFKVKIPRLRKSENEGTVNLGEW